MAELSEIDGKLTMLKIEKTNKTKQKLNLLFLLQQNAAIAKT